MSAVRRTAGDPRAPPRVRQNLAWTPFYLTLCRTIFPLQSLQSRWIASARSQRADRKRQKTQNLPGPDHPITITPNPKRVRVSADGVVIAETTHALTLKEASYPAVQYVPRSDANMALLARTERVTHCPYKGGANYFSIKANGKTIEHSIWTYHAPFPAMSDN